ncbi:MAG: transposase [Stenomitos rutilans HA7619-LM2]|jgi:putative transposase|nr:transposase [Stenomitos rutilans HA7619-LM2]
MPWALTLAARNHQASDNSKGFVLLPKRWVIERTWGWLNWPRRLFKDYAALPETSATFMYVVMTRYDAQMTSIVSHSQTSSKAQENLRFVSHQTMSSHGTFAISL